MNKKILIIDDDIMTLKILKKYLEGEYDVQIEKDGYRFVEKMDSVSCDLILLDIEMPVMNGLEVFDRILSQVHLKDTPVAFLSGVADPNLVREVMAKGAAGYFVKTAPKAELLEKVSNLFEKISMRQNAAKILIADNDVENLKWMRDILVKSGYLVKGVRNVLDAVLYIKNHNADLVILGRDANGNSMKGVLKEIEPMINEKRLPVIVMEDKFFDEELIEKVGSELEK